MSVKFGYSVLLFFVFTLFCGSATLYKGDKCSSKDGSDGTCKIITECPTAGVHPTICGFEKNESIICCVDGNARKTNATTRTRITGEISKQKCKEYAQYAFEKFVSPTLLLKPQILKRLECDWPRYKLVIGGTVATKMEFPHMALIGFKLSDEVFWRCGGSLISENFVLTAGHCLVTRDESRPALVRIGLTNKTDLDHVQERAVSDFIIHPEYKVGKYNDIGLLRLSKNVDFNIHVRPACLQTEKNIPQDKAIATGWGTIGFLTEGSDVLLKVVSEFVSADNCSSSYKPTDRFKYGIVDDMMICTGVTAAQYRNTCQGDSGGPLQVYHNDTEDVKCMYDIIGVISFGKQCGLTNIPVVNTRVSHYIKWIEDIVWPN